MTFSRSLIGAFLAAAILASAAGCSSSSSSNAPATIKIDGSTALQPLVEQAAADYSAKHPEVKIVVNGGGSAKGIFDASNHSVDIGNSDVDAALPALVDHAVAVNAFAVVVGPNTGVQTLSKAQIAKIFDKAVTNWKQLGGHDQVIVLINRPLGSGTRKVFSTYFLGGREPDTGAMTLESSTQVAQKVKNTPGAVSYVALSYANRFNVPVVSVNGVAPTVDNIRNRSYAFWAYEHMYTTAKSSPAADAFIDYLRSDDGVIDRLGFIAIKDVAKASLSSPSTTQ